MCGRCAVGRERATRRGVSVHAATRAAATMEPWTATSATRCIDVWVVRRARTEAPTPSTVTGSSSLPCGWSRSLRLYGLGFLHYGPFLWIGSTIAREYCTDACFWCFVARRLVPCCYRTPFSHLSKTPVLQLMSRVRVLRVVRGMEFKKLFELNSDPLKDADTTVIRLYKGQPSVVWNVPL